MQRVAGEDVISGRRADGADDVLRPREAIGGDLLLRLNRVAGVEKQQQAQLAKDGHLLV